MIADWIPMRWPRGWKDPANLELLKGTAINCLLVDRNDETGTVAARARQAGFNVADVSSPPAGVSLVDGEWPGVKLNPSGAVDTVAAGPTGNPWIDSNGWKIRLASALKPGNRIWVAATPQEGRLFPGSYAVAVADAAAHGGRWIITLDDRLAAGVAGGNLEALETWSRLRSAVGFFEARKTWTELLPEALLGVVSDFSGPNEFLSHEILNLSGRANLHYRILLKSRLPDAAFRGLKGVLYPDAEPPGQELQQQVLDFVRSGGLLITGPNWGPLPGTPAAVDPYPGYDWRSLGQGRIAAAKEGLEEPYLAVNDAVLLISHRHDLLRFWNGGAVCSHFTMDAARKRAVVHLLFYTTARSSAPTVRVAGRYRAARLWTLDQSGPRNVEMQNQQDAVELHLPPVSPYAALELEA